MPSFQVVGSRQCTFSITPCCIRKIPLNPPLQKGEVFGVLGLIEMFIGFTQIAGLMKRHKRRETQ